MTLIKLLFVGCAVMFTVTLVASSALQPRPRMCMIYCPYGFQQNSNGQSICVCKKSPCDGDRAPLEGYFCGRSPDRRECPSTHQCKVAPNDAYAVCCPRHEEAQSKSFNQIIKKPGSCPEPSGGMGICIAQCTTDQDCNGNYKCCGGCPRLCVEPAF